MKRKRTSPDDSLRSRKKSKKSRVSKKRRDRGELYNGSVFGIYFPMDIFKIMYDYMATEYCYNELVQTVPIRFARHRCMGRACKKPFAVYYEFDCLTISGITISNNSRIMKLYCFEHSPYNQPIRPNKMIALKYRNKKRFRDVVQTKKHHVNFNGFTSMSRSAPIMSPTIFDKKFSWSDILPLITSNDALMLLEETLEEHGLVLN